MGWKCVLVRLFLVLHLHPCRILTASYEPDQDLGGRYFDYGRSDDDLVERIVAELQTDQYQDSPLDPVEKKDKPEASSGYRLQDLNLSVQEPRPAVVEAYSPLGDSYEGDSQPGHSNVADSQPKDSYVPEGQPKDSYVPEIQPKDSYVPESQPKDSYIPESQPKDSYVPKSPLKDSYVAENPSSQPQLASDVTESTTGPVHHVPGNMSPLQHHEHHKESATSSMFDSEDKIFIVIITVAVSTCFLGLLLAGVCYYRFRKSAKASSDVEYPAYGVTGPTKDRVPSPGDRKLAQSAQMYHYQHQKQQMIAMERANGEMKHDASEDDSEEDNVEGDYTVYECPGLAPTGEMEVRNPLFRGEETPVTPDQDLTAQPNDEQTPAQQGHH